MIRLCEYYFCRRLLLGVMPANIFCAEKEPPKREVLFLWLLICARASLQRCKATGNPKALQNCFLHKNGRKTRMPLSAAAIFLQALQAALDSGDYILNQKGKPQRSDTAQLLGIQDRDRTAIPALLAYKIYSEYTPHPLTRLALWGVLEQAGAIRPRTETPQEVNFWGQSVRVIHINSKSIKERSL